MTRNKTSNVTRKETSNVTRNETSNMTRNKTRNETRNMEFDDIIVYLTKDLKGWRMVLALTKEKDRKEDSETEGMSNNCIELGGGGSLGLVGLVQRDCSHI